MLGAATAAHQVEGNNIHSDYWVQEQIEHSLFKEPSLDAVDHYNKYEEDIRLMAEAGLNTYRFSIEWARIQPEKELWIEDEIEHYRAVLKTCHQYGILPIVTMHHFSSPKWLISEGGWESEQVMTYFTNYCLRVVEALGDEMEYVCTINEANMRLQLAALIRDIMSGKRSSNEDNSDVQVGFNAMQSNMALSMQETAAAFGILDPRKVHTFLSQCTDEGDLLVMKTHQAARDAMKEKCPHLKIGLTLSLHDFQALEGGAELAEKEWHDEFMHYLPYISQDDFLGVQSYTRKILGKDGVVKPGKEARLTQMGYEDYPKAITNVVRKVAKSFKGDLIITENGLSTDDDQRRIEFIKEAMTDIQLCIADGIPIKGYMYWSLLDNFEWQQGYDMTFGLIAVERPSMKRMPKESLKYLGSFLGK